MDSEDQIFSVRELTSKKRRKARLNSVLLDWNWRDHYEHRLFMEIESWIEIET